MLEGESNEVGQIDPFLRLPVIPDSAADVKGSQAVWSHKYLQDGPLLDLCQIKCG